MSMWALLASNVALLVVAILFVVDTPIREDLAVLILTALSTVLL
jgi:hypothetical protein